MYTNLIRSQARRKESRESSVLILTFLFVCITIVSECRFLDSTITIETNEEAIIEGFSRKCSSRIPPQSSTSIALTACPTDVGFRQGDVLSSLRRCIRFFLRPGILPSQQTRDGHFGGGVGNCFCRGKCFKRTKSVIESFLFSLHYRSVGSAIHTV